MEEIQNGREDEEKDVSSYWMTFRDKEYTGICKRKRYMEKSLGRGCGHVARR
jgi:hypothetical protein